MNGHRAGISSPAFTIVEMLVATALATMLMVAVMGLAASGGQMRKVVEARAAQPDWVDRMMDLIRWDLEHACWVETGPDRLVLHGYGSLEGGQGGNPRHQRVQTEYALRTVQGRSYLVRRETQVDDLTNQNRFVSPVCADVAEFVLRTEEPQSRSAQTANPATRHEVPGAVRVTVRLAPRGDRPVEILEKVIVVR